MSPSPSPASGSAREALTDAALLALDTALTVGAALRVTRFATTDVLGGWVLSDPLHAWASRHEPADPPHPFGYPAPPSAPLHRLVSALDCPYCVGTQAALAIGAALALTSSRTAPSWRSRRSAAGRAVRAAAASLAAAYVVGHVSHRLDGAPSPSPSSSPSSSPSPWSSPSSPSTKDSK